MIFDENIFYLKIILITPQMSITKQLREDLTKDFGFLTETSSKFPKKRIRPVLKDLSSKPVTVAADDEISEKNARKQKAEEYRKKALKNKRVMADHDDKNPGKKVKNSKNEKIRDQVFRVEFPKQLIEEFPFLGFPDMEEDNLPIFKLFDSKLDKNHMKKLIQNIVFQKNNEH